MPLHIKRLIITFAVVVALFIVLRYLVIPKSFGEFGHYRGSSLKENADKPLLYAGMAACIKCHNDVVDQINNGRHKTLACESCHGPAYMHATFADSTGKVKLPDSLQLISHNEITTRDFCLVCHRRNVARMKIFFDTINKSVIKMVDNGHPREKVLRNPKADTLACVECHSPHDPFP